MQVQVERCAGHLGVGMPVRFRFDGRETEIVEIRRQSTPRAAAFNGFLVERADCAERPAS